MCYEFQIISYLNYAHAFIINFNRKDSIMIKHIKWMWNDLMIQACLWSTLLYSIGYPNIKLLVMRSIDPKYIAFEGIFISVSTIITSSCFNKWGDKIFKFMPVFLITESVLYCGLVPSILTGVVSVKAYFIIDIIAYSCIARNIICCGSRMRRILYKDEVREQFDNSLPIASAIASVIGGTVVMCCTIPLWLSWVIMGVGTSIDNVFLYVVYRRVKKMAE